MGWVNNLKQMVRAYVGDKKKKKPATKPTTKRTEQVKVGLKAAGLTQDEVDRLQGKKKK